MSIVIEKQITCKKLDSGVVLAYFDVPGKANYLTTETIQEFEDLLREWQADESVKAIGILSSKSDTFILGADLKEIIKMGDRQAAYKASKSGQRVFHLLADLNKPVVVGIHGTCLGGGLELILCCDKRIATNEDVTIFGLPEVRLGFVPGLGGTQRLPRLIDLKDALEIIVSAEPISAKKAAEIKLIDELVEPAKLEEKVVAAALALVDVPTEEKIISEQDKKRQQTVLSAIRRVVKMRTKGRYPAQMRVLDVVQTGLEQGIEIGLEEEAKAFGELAVSEISNNLVSLFFSTEFAKHTAASSAERAGVKIKTIGIIGGGMMGVGLAKLAALNGIKVIFRPARKESLSRAVENIKADLQKLVERSANNEINAAENIKAAEDDRDFHSAEIIFEAAEEKLATKAAIFNSIKSYKKDDSIFATITSSLTVAEMEEQLRTAVVAVHLFSPVEKMPLVEVATGANTDKAALAKISALITQLGKIPVFVKDTPCFLVNRLLSCYLLEAARLAEENVPLNWLDEAAVDFGMPMGPLELLDEIGMDVALLVTETLKAKYGGRIALPAVLTKVKEIGIKGKKTGVGIYQWDEAGRKNGFDSRMINDLKLNVSTEKQSQEEAIKLANRMILPMVDEAARCLEEKVVRRQREIDIATVFGIGFPAFRGGLLKYADGYGIAALVAELENIYAKTSPKREVSEMLKKMAATESKFYNT